MFYLLGGFLTASPPFIVERRFTGPDYTINHEVPERQGEVMGNYHNFFDN